MYLASTTVLISKDGVFYIEQSQRLPHDPVTVTKTLPPGYPFLIYTAHKFTRLFTSDLSINYWVYSAQAVTLLCRLFALIPLYFIGKLLVGTRNSFWAILFLIILPHPAKMGNDVLREWPYLLFLAAGFLFLLIGAKQKRWWLFGLVGLSCGFGYLFRHESAQLLVYGILWLVMSLFSTKRHLSIPKFVAAMVMLLIGFMIIAGPYMKCTGEISPSRVRDFFKKELPAVSNVKDAAQDEYVSPKCYITSSVPYDLVKASWLIFQATGEILMWYFLPVLVIGFCWRFRNEAQNYERFLMLCFVLTNVVLMVMRYYYIESHISRRWCLPLVAFTVFYIPVGFEMVTAKLDTKWPLYKPTNSGLACRFVTWFGLLCVIGIGLCMPKLLSPAGSNKSGYRNVSKWLKENTAEDDLIAVPDKRILFYAERKGCLYNEGLIPAQMKYAVGQGNEQLHFRGAGAILQRYDSWLNPSKKRHKVTVYEINSSL